jgi:hypothetical protein
MAEDMVLAVYIPPQAPAPGHVLNNFKVLRGNRVIELFPKASNAETIFKDSPSIYRNEYCLHKP